MTQEIYEKVMEVLKSINKPMEPDQILIKLNSVQLRENAKIESTIKINALIKQQRDIFLSKKALDNFSLEDNLYITQSQQKTKRNEYLILLGKIQLKKIETLVQFYTKKLDRNQTIQYMQQLLNQEANTRKEMLLYDIKARNIVSKTKSRIKKKPISDTKIITKDEEDMLNLNIDNTILEIPESLLLSPRILDCYALDILLVLNEQKEFKKK